jgi:PA-IL-like protein
MKPKRIRRNPSLTFRFIYLFGGNMLLQSNFLRLIFTLTFVLGLSLVVFADTVRLKDGSIVKGRVIGFKDGQFVIIIGDGGRQRQMTFYADEIEAIDFDSNGATVSNTKVVTNSNQTQVTPETRPTPVANNSNTTTSNPNVKVIGGQNSTNNQTPTQSNTSVVATNASNNTPKTRPSTIQINSKVLADNTSNGWTNTGWVVKKGQKIRISGTGRISLGNGRYSTPSGVSSLPDNEKLMKNSPTGGLIAVIGDDNNDFIFLGGSTEFVATRDGALFLGINEGYLDDNSGAFDVVLEIDPMNNTGN